MQYEIKDIYAFSKEPSQSQKWRGSTKKILLLIFAAVIVFFLGYFVRGAFFYGLPQRLVGREAPERYQDVDFSKYWEALEKIENSYIGEIDYIDLVEGSIAGMVASLNDPFSVYISPEAMSLFQSEINGTFEGIGVEITVREGELVVIAPLEGSPAEKAGLEAGDVIKLVDDENVGMMTLEQAILKIRGEKGTEVVLTIFREGEGEMLEIIIVRGVIEVKSVRYELKEDNIAYLRILRFDSSTKSLFNKYISELKKDGARGIILDLRNNPGGYLESAIEVASEFIADGVVAIEEFKGDKKEEIYSMGEGKLVDFPVVVLVNQGSASGSEIVAGAIRDRERGVLVGEKTFGKGTVQEVDPLSRGGALKITIAKWLTPNGTDINENGLIPDIEVESGGEEDGQLERAMEEMRELIE